MWMKGWFQKKITTPVLLDKALNTQGRSVKEGQVKRGVRSGLKTTTTTKLHKIEEDRKFQLNRKQETTKQQNSKP